MGFDGLGMVASSKHGIGDLVQVTLSYGEQMFSGLARIRNVKQLKDGKFRYGLEAMQTAWELRKALRDINLSIQREQLRSFSGRV